METKEKKQQAAEAIETLRKLLKPGDTVHGIIRSVSRSGMSRRIDFYKLVDGDRIYLTGLMVDVGIGHQSYKDWQQSRGMRVDGCGMDMIFACVYQLGCILWPNGCDGGAHRNSATNGGYALRSQQL